MRLTSRQSISSWCATRRVFRHRSEQQATRYSSRTEASPRQHTHRRCGPSFLGKYEKRRAAWCMTSTSHTYFRSLLPRAVPSSHLLPTLLVALNGWASSGGHDPLLTVACTAPRRVPLSLFEVKSRIRAVSALSSIFLPWAPVRDRSGTHAGEAPSSCCTAPASPSQA